MVSDAAVLRSKRVSADVRPLSLGSALCVHSIPCTRSGPFIRRTTHYAWFAVAPTPLATETPEESEVALMDGYRAEMGG